MCVITYSDIPIFVVYMKRSPPLTDLQCIHENGIVNHDLISSYTLYTSFIILTFYKLGSLSKLGSFDSYHGTYSVKISSIVPVHMKSILTIQQNGFTCGSIYTNNNNSFESADEYVLDSSNSETIALENREYDDISYLSPKSKINKLRRSLDVSQMCKEFIKTAESLDLLNISSDTTSILVPATASSKYIVNENFKDLSCKEDKNEKMIYDIMKTLKVVIADDALVDRKFLSKIVKSTKSLEASIAENGIECAKLCQTMLNNNNNVIIFMDINMPKKNGWEATREIRNLENGLAPFIIGMSSFDTPEYYSSSLEAGMNTFVSKPFTIKKVQSLFNEIVLNDSDRNINVDILKPGFNNVNVNDSKTLSLPQEILI